MPDDNYAEKDFFQISTFFFGYNDDNNLCHDSNSNNKSEVEKYIVYLLFKLFILLYLYRIRAHDFMLNDFHLPPLLPLKGVQFPPHPLLSDFAF